MKNILVLLFCFSLAFTQQVNAQEQQAEEQPQEQTGEEGQEEDIDEADDPDELANYERELQRQFTERDTSVVEKEPEERLPFVSIHHKVYADSIVVRWAPSDRRTWLLANKAGYLLERVEYELTMTREEFENTNPNDIPRDYAREIIKQLPGEDQPIFPYDSVTWAPYFPNDDKYALLAAGATAGSLEVDPSHGFAVQGQQNNSIFGIVLLAADLSPLAADGLGFRYVDTDIEKGKSYEYRITSLDSATRATFDSLSSLNPLELLAAGDTAGVSKLMEWKQHGSTYAKYDDQHIERPLPIEGLYSVFGDKRVAIRWSAEPYANDFSGYFLEKSQDGGVTWDTLTNNIFIGNPIELEEDTTERTGNYHLVYDYLDIFDTNYVEYSYRIRGIDAFGDESLPSIVKGMGRDLTPPLNPAIKSGKFLEKKGQIELIYSLPEIPSDLADLYFEYAYHVDSSYARYEVETLDPRDTVYYHAPEPDEYSHYFRMVAEDSAQNKSYSFPVFVNIPDTIPPPVPTGLHAEIDSTGEVDIQWDDEMLAERGFLGYRVYYSNHPDHEFTQLTTKPVNSNFYIYHLPLNTLTEKIYYKVQAVDMSYNHSEFTEVIEASKPDKIAPIAPVFRSPVSSEEHITLSWSPSDSEDVEQQVITRRNGEDVQQFIMDPFISTFIDTLAEVGSIYQYEIHAVDDAGLASPTSFPVRARRVDRKRLPGVENLQVDFNAENQLVSVTWNYGEPGDELKFAVYRGNNQNKLKRHALIEGTQPQFSEEINKSGTYYYAVKVLHQQGQRSVQSDWVSITIGE